jgi:hypothetical protein
LITIFFGFFGVKFRKKLRNLPLITSKIVNNIDQDGKLGVWPAQQALGKRLTEDLRNNRTHEMIGHFESGNPLRRPPRCSIQNDSLEYRFVLRGLWER